MNELRRPTRPSLGDVLFAASGETLDEIGKSAANLSDRLRFVVVM